MRSTIQYGDISWIDIQTPNLDDVNYLRENFNFHKVVLDELIPPSHRAKVENYRDYLFMILYYPALNKARKETFPRELDILVTKTHIITSHYKAITPLGDLFKRMNIDENTKKEHISQGTGYMLFYIVNLIIQSAMTKIMSIEHDVRHIEKEIFKGREREMVFEISETKRAVIDFRRILAPQVPVMDSLVSEGITFFGPDLSPYFEDLRGTFGIVWHDLQEHRENIQALAETNESLLTTKTNEVIKVLTVFSVIFLPITLLANIYGMNLEKLPSIGGNIDFWLIIAIMGGMVIAMFMYFKTKKWI